MLYLTSLRLISFGIAFTFLIAACSSDNTSHANVSGDFSINGVKGTINGQNVTIDLTEKEACSDITNLITGIQANGATISPDPSKRRDYTQPVQFTLTSPDATISKVYIVTVKANNCECVAPPVTPPVTPPIVPPVVPPVNPPVVPCTAAVIGSTGYSQVFKGCSASNVAEYFDKTECVRDNVSGLIWQGQTPAGTGLRANDQYKTNFNSTTALQQYSGVVAGNFVYRAPTQAEVDAITNTVGFKNAINSSNLCGSAAWRIPTSQELLSIVKLSESPTIDNASFPNTPSDGLYWSSTDYPFGPEYSFLGDFRNGDATGSYTTRSNDGGGSFQYPRMVVRLVRP